MNSTGCCILIVHYRVDHCRNLLVARGHEQDILEKDEREGVFELYVYMLVYAAGGLVLVHQNYSTSISKRVHERNAGFVNSSP